MNKAEGDMPVDDLVSLAKLVLENNFFEFDENVFRQKLGTAMGTKFAPGFANIFMGYFEEQFLDSCELKPWGWLRFLDDVFSWTDGRTDERADGWFNNQISQPKIAELQMIYKM